MRRVLTGRASGAFTLTEFLLALSVLVLASVLLFSVLGRMRRGAQREKLGADLRGLAAAFEKYHVENGRWPGSPEKAAQMIEALLPEAPPFGGHYGWVPPGARGRPAMIELTAYSPDFPLTLSAADLREIDRLVDDGDLAAGRFRTAFNGWPVYLVEASP